MLNLILDKKQYKVIEDSFRVEILNAIKDDEKVAQEIFNLREQGDMKQHKQEWQKFVEQQREELEFYNSKR
jgi:hypothetical protein